MKRKYTRIKTMEAQIIEMRSAGKSRGEIVDKLGITLKELEDWTTRYNRRMEGRATGIPKAAMPGKRRGRPRKRELSSEEAYKHEIQRLTMENELLRDFLHLAGRRRGQG